MATLLALLVSVGWASAPVGEEPSPDWKDDRTRHAAQVQVLNTMIDSGLAPQALASATQIREKEGSWLELDLVQARALHTCGLYEESELLLGRIVRRHPRHAGAWALLGLVRADRQDAEGAVKALAKAVRIDPNQAAWLNNLGFLYLSTGDLERATLTLREALRLDPASSRTRNNLAFALAADEKDSEALQLFRSTSDEADARYNLGVACERRGDIASALTQYQAALSARTHPAAAASIHRLTQGTP